jgi:hypothetical protein
MFGLLPAGAVYARHVRHLRVRQTRITFAQPDTRPRAVLDDVDGAQFERLDWEGGSAPPLLLRQVRGLSITRSAGLRDRRDESAEGAGFTNAR